MKVNILEAKTRLSELIRAAQAGEEVIIANRGQPVVKIVAISAQGERPYPVGSAAGYLDWARNRPAPTWRVRSAGEIDADLNALRDEWE